MISIIQGQPDIEMEKVIMMTGTCPHVTPVSPSATKYTNKDRALKTNDSMTK
jgi:hypothetical protein